MIYKEKTTKLIISLMLFLWYNRCSVYYTNGGYMEPVVFNQVLPQIILLVATAAVSMIAYVGKKAFEVGSMYLSEKLGLDKFNMLKDYALLVVRDLEQTTMKNGWSGEEKKKAAMLELQKFAAQYGINVDLDQLSKITEGCVNTVKIETGVDLSAYLKNLPPKK